MAASNFTFQTPCPPSMCVAQLAQKYDAESSTRDVYLLRIATSLATSYRVHALKFELERGGCSQAGPAPKRGTLHLRNQTLCTDDVTSHRGRMHAAKEMWPSSLQTTWRISNSNRIQMTDTTSQRPRPRLPRVRRCLRGTLSSLTQGDTVPNHALFKQQQQQQQ
jgi:hypothetical protein